MNGPHPGVAVIGVGGAGINAVTRLGDVGLPRVRFIAVDTSAQTLARAGGADRVLLAAPTGGHGTGGDAALGAAAAERAVDRLDATLGGIDLAFVVAGLAGGTGGGAAPVVARAACAAGAMTVGFGITPFAFEARRRVLAAERALAPFADACDTTVLLDNQRAQALAGGRVTLDVALRVADDVLRQAVQGLSAMIGGQGWIHVDWPLVRAMLAQAGDGCLALGLGRGHTPAQAAMRAALASPLADMRALAHARAVLVQVAGGPDLALHDTAEALDTLRRRLGPDCELVVGAGHDPTLAGSAQVVILGTGLADSRRRPVAWPGRRERGSGDADHRSRRVAIAPLAASWAGGGAAMPLREVV